MKWVYKIAYGLLFAVTVLAAAGSLYYYSRVNDNKNEEAAYEFRNYPDYYFSLILNTEDDIYWKDFKDGATEAAKRFNISLEFNEVSEPEIQTSIVEYIHIANQSKMDGIIVAGKSSDEYNAAIKEATESGINVVVDKYNDLKSDRVAQVGINNYEYGEDAAELIAKLKTSDSQIDLAIIWSEQYRDENTVDPVTQIIMNGMSKAPINLASTLYGTSELLGAEDQIRNTLNEHPDIDVILCTNAKDTVSAANVIRERNLVGKVFIVGTDVTDQIIDYIKRGVIFGVLDRNGYSAGYQSVRMLYDSMGTTFSINNFSAVNINTYTAENISKYTKP